MYSPGKWRKHDRQDEKIRGQTPKLLKVKDVLRKGKNGCVDRPTSRSGSIDPLTTPRLTSPNDEKKKSRMKRQGTEERFKNNDRSQ